MFTYDTDLDEQRRRILHLLQEEPDWAVVITFSNHERVLKRFIRAVGNLGGTGSGAGKKVNSATYKDVRTKHWKEYVYPAVGSSYDSVFEGLDIAGLYKKRNQIAHGESFNRKDYSPSVLVHDGLRALAILYEAAWEHADRDLSKRIVHRRQVDK